MCEIGADLVALIAYARVSTEGQTLEAQVRQLKTVGAEKITKEKISGARADRLQLKKAIAVLAPGSIAKGRRSGRHGRAKE